MRISNETKVGILTVFAVTFLILGYNFLKGKDIFTNTKDLYAKYDHINGIDVSNPILYNGMTVGKITKLELLPDRTILATLTIKEEIPVPKNTVARIESQDLLGAKAVNLELGNSTVMAEEGDTLVSEVEISLAESVNEQVRPVKAKAEKLLVTMDSILISIQYILNPQFRENIDRSFYSIKRSIQTIEQTAYRMDALVEIQSTRLNAITANVESITSNLKNNNQRITDVLVNLDRITDTLARAKIASTIYNANKALAEFSIIAQKINRGEGSMGLLVNNPQLYNNLNTSAINLDKLLVDLRQNPKRYVGFSIFGGSTSTTTPKKTTPPPKKN